ncbi:hypothetical protein CAEBREN_23429 [Caenorhabditis brenneri]|uniref:Uncharacterized protein n=1 Tax=Caenorhabditis brenneri TaxID=135651 RepID=G0P006_CAEBE|nr:hypothetical protein CAEBREN_23429 [Caenorhabditis brenneri]
MASYILNALTLRHDHDAAERTLHHFWDTKDLLDSDLIEEHIASQPLLAASLFSLVACSIGLIIFAIVFLTCRFRGQCGSQKYQEYPSNSTNYAIYLMLFFISWLIVTSAAAYFVLAGIGFWSEKLDARRSFANASLRLSRSTISDLFANYDYQGDFESVSEAPSKKGLKRIHIHRKPLLQTFRKRIEIPIRPLAEVTFSGTSDKFITKNRQRVEDLSSNLNEVSEEEEKIGTLPEFESSQPPLTQLPTEEEIKNQVQEHSGIPGKIAEIFGEPEQSENLEEAENPSAENSEEPVEPNEPPEPEQGGQTLVVTGETMTIEEDDDVEDSEKVTVTTQATTTTVPLTTTKATATEPVTTTTTSTVPPSTTTTQLFREITWKQIEEIGQVVSINASIFLFLSPLMLLFSTFTLFYTHSHELLCATIQLQHQQSRGLIDTNHQSLIENYSINTNQCSRSLAPIQSLLLSSLLLCISLLPCVFAMFKLVKYYFRMSSEFYWNAADNFAGRQFSKQQDFPRYQSTVIYPDDDMTTGYASELCISLLPCVFAMFKLVKYYFRMSSEFYWNAADNFAGRQFSKQQDFPRYQSTVIYPDDDMTTGYAVYGQI